MAPRAPTAGRLPWVDSCAVAGRPPRAARVGSPQSVHGSPARRDRDGRGQIRRRDSLRVPIAGVTAARRGPAAAV